MDASGIIAEFDPFHNGHKYLLDTVHAELPSHALVCVMSGNFVQRGMPAVCDKFVRAEAAVRCGADLVLELPFVYACNSAPEFAKGGVKVLKAAGCSHIAFGSESGDVKKISRAAELSAGESDEFKAKLREGMEGGGSYASAYSAALSLVDPASDGLRGSPNDMLAAEYLKQNLLQEAGLEPLCVRRRGAGHGSMQSEELGYSSASAVREQIARGDMKKVIVNLPEEIHELALSASYNSTEAKHRLFEIIRYSIITGGAVSLSGIYGMNEGLENAFAKAAVIAPNTNDLIMAVKTRRYTYARLSRLLMYIITGLKADEAEFLLSRPLPYIRPLAMNSRGAALLRGVRERGEIDVVSNINRYVPEKDPAAAAMMLRYELLSSDIYSIISGISIYQGSDRVKSPFVLKS